MLKLKRYFGQNQRPDQSCPEVSQKFQTFPLPPTGSLIFIDRRSEILTFLSHKPIKSWKICFPLFTVSVKLLIFRCLGRIRLVVSHLLWVTLRSKNLFLNYWRWSTYRRERHPKRVTKWPILKPRRLEILYRWWLQLCPRVLPFLQYRIKTPCNKASSGGKQIRLHKQNFRNSSEKYCQMVQKGSHSKGRSRQENRGRLNGNARNLMDA